MKIVLVTVLLFLCVVERSEAQDSLSLTLKEVIDIALKSNIEVSTSQLRIQSSEHAVKEAAGNFLPKLTLNGSYNRNIDKQVIFLPEGFGGGGPTRIGLNNNFATSVDLTVPIYSQAYQTNKAYTTRNLDLAKETSRGTQQSAVNKISKAYYQAVAAYETVKVRQKALQNAIENSANVEAKLTNGIATEFDKTFAAVKVKAAQNDLLNAQKQAQISVNNLKLLAGIGESVKLRLADSLLIVEGDMFNPNEQSFDLNSSLRQARLQQLVAAQQVDAVKAGYFPALSAVGSYQYQSQQNDFNFNEYRWVKTSYVGLKLQLPLFNGMVTRNKVQQALFSQKIAQLQNEYTVMNLQSQLKQVIADIQYSTEKLELQRENISLSEKALALTKERFNYGKGTFIEISSAELDLVSARLNYLQAIFEYKSALCDYQLLTGRENQDQ